MCHCESRLYREETIITCPFVPTGFLKAYRKFWKFNDDYVKTVPPILIYADLLNTRDPRNIETAQKIYEKYNKEKPVHKQMHLECYNQNDITCVSSHIRLINTISILRLEQYLLSLATTQRK